jgi:hypothetical protein
MGALLRGASFYDPRGWRANAADHQTTSWLGCKRSGLAFAPTGALPQPQEGAASTSTKPADQRSLGDDAYMPGEGGWWNLAWHGRS